MESDVLTSVLTDLLTYILTDLRAYLPTTYSGTILYFEDTQICFVTLCNIHNGIINIEVKRFISNTKM